MGHIGCLLEKCDLIRKYYYTRGQIVPNLVFASPLQDFGFNLILSASQLGKYSIYLLR